MLRKLVVLVFAIGFFGFMPGILMAHNEAVLIRFEDGSGSIASDISGNNNHATLYNSPTWTTGKTGGGIAFSNTGLDIQPDIDDPDSQWGLTGDIGRPAEEITLQCWFKANSVQGSQGLITYGEWAMADLRLEGNQLLAQIVQPSWVDSNPVMGGTVYAGVWHHGAMTYSPTTKQLIAYLDGTEVTRRTTNGGNMRAPSGVRKQVAIGASRATGGALDGVIDDVVVSFDIRTKFPEVVYEIGKDTIEVATGLEAIEAKLDAGVDLSPVLDAIDDPNSTDDLVGDHASIEGKVDTLNAKVDALETKLDIIDQLLRTPQGKRQGWNE